MNGPPVPKGSILSKGLKMFDYLHYNMCFPDSAVYRMIYCNYSGSKF